MQQDRSHEQLEFGRLQVSAAVLFTTANVALANPLTTFATNLNTPIGIDWDESRSNSILSLNYSTGSTTALSWYP
jgi:hypothetical protein